MEKKIMLPRIKCLTGLRFFAASMIILHHINDVSLWIPKGFGIELYINFGNAVTFFFCLSGFVLHYNYHQKIKSTPWWIFFISRFLRVWPLHAVIFLWSLFLFYPTGTHWILNNFSWLELTQIFTLTQSLNPDLRVFFGVNGVSWFISTLVFLYAAFPFISRGVGKKPWATLFLVISVSAVYLAVASTVLYNPSVYGSNYGFGSVNPIARLINFTLGVITCEWLLRLGLIDHLKSQVEKRKIVLTIIELAVFVVVLLAVYFSWRFFLKLHSSLNLVLWAFFITSYSSFFYCLLIALFAYERGWVSRLFGTRVFVWLGSLSFAIFLVHQRLIDYWKRYIEPSSMPIGHQVVSYFVALIVISAGCYYLIEIPATNRMRKIVNKKESS